MLCFEKNNFRDGWTNFNSQENNNDQETTDHIPVKILHESKIDICGYLRRFLLI